ncbi:type II restriction enzyme [Saccharicrinis carchari]|uniref:Type-2 restriction enzyme n=1 Tax=Saccharicrinis carchari TaxID=1168039 RepID=A0A521F8Z5_SACCC|nr:type II restriction endonuclease [Saccharicrinis carchari]SMO92596.1 type II restriction enzyme [Saccharicrinis carchari]
MKKLTSLLELQSDDQLFDSITSNFKNKITQWNYFVNWEKVLGNIDPIEKELNLLNYLIGKDNIEEEAFKLIKQYPTVVKAFPNLLAIREKSVDVLIDTKNFIYKKFVFNKTSLDDNECRQLAQFLIKSGIASLFQKKKIKNLVDYTTGVEVGLDSNGRKNRGGSLMESLVEDFVAETCNELNIGFMPQATAKKIKQEWGLDVAVDKSSRIIDFAINKNGQLYFIECNFYGGGGSKLKSTATEYVEMNSYWNKQQIEFIWVTDGAGWKSTLKPLREYFDKAEYLINLEMLKNGILKNIIG